MIEGGGGEGSRKGVKGREREAMREGEPGCCNIEM